jgi:hypothetical protein
MTGASSFSWGGRAPFKATIEGEDERAVEAAKVGNGRRLHPSQAESRPIPSFKEVFDVSTPPYPGTGRSARGSSPSTTAPSRRLCSRP